MLVFSMLNNMKLQILFLGKAFATNVALKVLNFQMDNFDVSLQVAPMSGYIVALGARKASLLLKWKKIMCEHVPIVPESGLLFGIYTRFGSDDNTHTFIHMDTLTISQNGAIY